MPTEFDACVKNGGRVRTLDLKDDKYQHVCFIGGKSFAGDVKEKKQEEGKKHESKESPAKEKAGE